MQRQVFIKDFESLAKALQLLNKEELALIGIDGRPCSGKTTLALQLAQQLNAQTIHIDEFFIPKQQWPHDAQPTCPFFYIKHEEFIQGLRKLLSGVAFTYLCHNWNTGLASSPKIITPRGPVIIEGISVLHDATAHLYNAKVWVASELKTEHCALEAREHGHNAREWENIFLPSVNLYTFGRPWEHADIMYAGRGIGGWNTTDVH